MAPIATVSNPKPELLKCTDSPAYFVDTYCQIFDAVSGEWIPFAMWHAQWSTINTIHEHRLVVILKARQLGLTWLVLGYALWLMMFRPAAVVLLFSRRDDEAVHLLDGRLKGMYEHLPVWLRGGTLPSGDSQHVWGLSNGSEARAFPTTAGDSYTASLAIVDEADLVPDLNRLMNAVKPTIDGGGRMILLSRADKSRPDSEFKRIYMGGKQGDSGWASVFLPWHAHPGRDAAWYERQRQDVQTRTGSLDDLHQQYPASDLEALAPRSLDKRIAPDWLQQVYVPADALDAPANAPAIPGLSIYAEPKPGQRFVIGVDPAEGNPTSDDSAMTVLNAESGEEAARLAGKFQPSTIAAHADTIGTYFNSAGVLVERNNHGHAVLLWLRDNSRLTRLRGIEGRDGWLSNSKGKALLYDAAADACRESQTVIHSFDTYVQLSSIEGSSLRAPEGQHDDLADSYALAVVAASAGSMAPQTMPSLYD